MPSRNPPGVAESTEQAGVADFLVCLPPTGRFEPEATMHVVHRKAATQGLESLAGVPLSVVFADGAELARVRDDGEGSVRLVPPFHVSDEDAYLVLPDDIGVDLLDILRDGDVDLVHEAMRDGLVV